MLVIQKGLNFLRLNLKHKDFILRYKELKKNQYLSYELIQQRQLKSLNKLLNHAYTHVPYYHKKFEELDIWDNNKINLKNLNEITKLPLLTKDIIIKEKENLYSNDIQERKSFKNTTGGSTGKPLSFLQDFDYVLSNKLNTQLSLSWRGFELYDDMITIWGAQRDTFEGKKPIKKSLMDFIQNKLVLNSFNMSNDDMRNYIKLLNIHQPKLIKAYAQSIYQIAKFAKENNIYVKKQNAVHLAAGTVYPFMKELIEDVFQCKSYNDYGSREAGTIASECSAQDGLHIMVEHVFVEVLDKNGQPCQYGEEGEIVITTLNNYSMPLIRYKIGDMGVLMENKKCSCGCSYPKLEKVIGRVTDIFKTTTGVIVAPEYFIHLIGVVLNRGNIEKFQVIQEELDKIVVKIVQQSEMTKDNLKEIEEKIKIVMGKECKVEFDFVDDIPTTATGKYQYTISKIEF